MRNISILVLGLAGLLLLSACSAETVEGPDKRAGTNANAGNSNTAPISNGAAVPAPLATDANANASTAAVAAGDDLGSAANKMDERLGSIRKMGAAGPDVDAEQIAMKNARPAPDNSTFASYLTDAGYEIRMFKNHPQLLKVQKKITPDGKQTVKIFLRDGKVVEVPGQKIAFLATVSAAHILEAGGIPAKPQTPSGPAGPTETKKSSE